MFPPEIMEQLGCKHVKVRMMMTMMIMIITMMIIMMIMMIMCRESSCSAPLAPARP